MLHLAISVRTAFGYRPHCVSGGMCSRPACCAACMNGSGGAACEGATVRLGSDMLSIGINSVGSFRQYDMRLLDSLRL